MAFRPVACTKYHAGAKRPEPKLPDGPVYVTDMSAVRAPVNPDIRQMQQPAAAASPVAGLSSSTPSVVPLLASVQRAQPMSSHISGHSPRPVRRPGREEEATGFSVPPTYESRDWQSMAKAQFKPTVAERVPPEVLEERRRATVASSVPVGFTKDPFAKTTHQKEFYPSYAPTDYAVALGGANRIGGPNDKTASSVVTAESDKALPGQYTTATFRQFQKPNQSNNGPAVDPSFVAHARALKANSNATHWSFGDDRPDYKPVSATPLPSTAPLVKNRPPSAAPRKEDNIFVAHTAEEARPRKMTAQEVAADKSRSTVPLMGNMMGDAAILPRHLTSSHLATPVYTAVRREMIKSGAPNAGAAGASSTATGLAAISSPGLRLGVDKTVYTPMAKAQFQGVFFGKPQSAGSAA